MYTINIEYHMQGILWICLYLHFKTFNITQYHNQLVSHYLHNRNNKLCVQLIIQNKPELELRLYRSIMKYILIRFLKNSIPCYQPALSTQIAALIIKSVYINISNSIHFLLDTVCSDCTIFFTFTILICYMWYALIRNYYVIDFNFTKTECSLHW